MAEEKAITPNETTELAKEDFRTRLTGKLIDQLEAGTAPWQKPWDARVDLMPQNPITGNPYRGINNLALTLEGRSDPRWMTYKQALAAGYQVNKGEKGAQIEYWKHAEQQPKFDAAGAPVLGPDGKPETISVTLARPRVFTAVVFNAEQMSGVPELVKAERTYQWVPEERAELILKASGATITHEQADRAFYRSSNDSIHMPGRDQFRSSEAYYGTALHELGHWTGHSSRLDRDLTGAYGSVSYAKEELRAEIASYFLADRLGIPHDPGHHASYVASWVEVLKQDKNEIFKAAAAAEKITEYVIGLEQEREVAQEQGLANEVAKQPHELTLDEFSEIAHVTALENHGRKFEVTALGGHAFSDASDTLGALVDVHAMHVNNALYQNDLELGQGITDASQRTISMPPETVLAQYPNLKEKYPTLFIGDKNILPLNSKAVFQEGGKAATQGLKYSENPYEKGSEEHLSWSQGHNDMRAKTASIREKSSGLVSPNNELPGKPPANNIASENTVLAVSFKEKEAAKEAGAKWDKEAKFWFAPKGADLSKLDKWLPKQEAAPQVAVSNPEVEFGDALRANGLVLDGLPIMDGKMHRVPVEGKGPQSKDGAYVGYLDGKPSGFIQNHSTGVTQKWTQKGVAMTPEQRAQLQAQTQINKELRAQELIAEHAKAADYSKYKWNKLSPPSSSEELTPYLVRKAVPAFGIKFDGDKAIVPVRDFSGNLKSLQTLPAVEGEHKLFVKGGEKKGNFHAIIPTLTPEIKDFSANYDALKEIPKGETIFVAEGYATGASVALATNKPVVIAFDCGNLDPVVAGLKERFPTNPIFIAADNDRGKEHNVGLEHAAIAAEKHQVGVIYPDMLGAKGSDFNDLAAVHGLSEVKNQVEAGIAKTMGVSRHDVEGLVKAHMGDKVQAVEPKENGKYSGTSLGSIGYHSAQQTGKSQAVIHKVADLNQVPKPNKDVSVNYHQGKGVVRPAAKDIDLGR